MNCKDIDSLVAVVKKGLLQAMVDTEINPQLKIDGLKLVAVPVTPANENSSQQTETKPLPLRFPNKGLGKPCYVPNWMKIKAQLVSGYETVLYPHEADWSLGVDDTDISSWDFYDYLPEGFNRLVIGSLPHIQQPIRVYYRGKYYKEMYPCQVVLADQGLDTPVGWKYV